MNKTVVAIFNSMKEAETAADDLFDNGFLKEYTDVSSGEKYGEEKEGESGITRFFKNLFGTGDEKTERYSSVAKKGYVVAVHTHSEEEALAACEILDDNGAVNVNDCYDKYFTPISEIHDEGDDQEIEGENINNNGEDYTGDRIDDEAATNTIPVIEEGLEVHKKEVTTGGVRVRSRIVEKPVEENLRLREEHVHVERKRVDREPTDEELQNFKNETADFAGQVNQRSETVHGKVRKTDMDDDELEN